MKKITAIASVAILAACQPAEAPVEEEVVEAAETAEGPQPGDWVLTNEEGITNFTIGEDNTWTSKNAESGEENSGTFEMVDGKACFSVEGSEEPPRCSSASEPDESGAVTVTYEDGSTAQVTPAPAAEEATAEEAAAE